MSEFFNSSLEHLLNEMKRIELKVKLRVMFYRRQKKQEKEDKFRGLYISEDEIDNIIGAGKIGLNETDAMEDNPSFSNLIESIEALESDIADRKRATEQRGIALRLFELEKSFRLSRFEVDTLLTCILPELDVKYQKVYAYLQDDLNKKSPTVDFILSLLAGTLEDKLKARQAFSPEAPLIRYRLIKLGDEMRQSTAPLLSRTLNVDMRITNYLLDVDQTESNIRYFTYLLYPRANLTQIILPEEIKRRLTLLFPNFNNTEFLCYFQGPPGIGKQITAEAICTELKQPLFVVDIGKMLRTEVPAESPLPLIFREGRLLKAVLYLDNFDALLNDEKGLEPIYQAVVNELEYYPGLVFLAGEKTWQVRSSLTSKPFIGIEFPSMTTLMRRQLWENNCRGKVFSPDIDFSELADKFRLNGDQIKAAAVTAHSIAFWRDPGQAVVSCDDLYLACRQQSNLRLSTLAKKILPKYQWDDIVLPKDQMDQLHEICNYIKYRHTVYDRWRFDKKLSLGKGLNALFAGPSGTGKTMAAEILAGQLGIDLYKINLSSIVSKYIGETEKNLENIFKEGQTANAILFFDEADALFGKRSEVRDSHDRYANIEIAYLLQRMEEYDGMVILATNMRKNMDEAFVRRLHFTVEFPLPEEADRCRIWQSVFPQESPRDQNIDLYFLARQFKITGGNIKNIALSAAFMAASNGGCITMDNLIKATKREYQKMGKLCTEGDFAQFFDLVKN
jgi:SpoVK/Ycf46/Vps4 family AAA+-type ATPase